MKITAIKAQVKNAERVSIYVDGAYSFSLTQNQLLEHRLRSGLELDADGLKKLQKASVRGKLLERALQYVMTRPRSEREVRDYMRRKEAESEVADDILRYLIEKKYIDDLAFAKSWIRNRQAVKPVSTRRLTAELLQKGVAASLIQQAVQSESFSEEQSLCDIVAKKRKLSRYQDLQKLTAYLLRQGFSYDAIKKALAE